ncbi:hypothetical protein [Clostridium tagluense]|uniref:Glycosyl transferase n=1 Tax=Clostridium tagluense TaxID=360422 RepID=A0A401UJT7_9CLOT|nr:hypothetical protein [Clostridium tagluense]GCD09729.1 glycosyl transferase [Clostridium tagluense]
MEKLIYIAYIDRVKDVGLYKKVSCQCEMFSKFYETILICRENNNIYIENFTYKNTYYSNDSFYPVYNKINNYRNLNIFSIFIYNYIRENEPQILYIRKYNYYNIGYKMILYAKKKTKCYLLWEIPTYPYKMEFTKNNKYLAYVLSKFLDYKIEKICDKIIVILGQNIKVKSSKYLIIRNGIKVDKIKTKDIKDIEDINVNKNCLNLVGVAIVHFWHGYDRIIEGLKNYYDSNKGKDLVYFHIAGDGAEIPNLKKLVDNYNLNSYVIFYGDKTGQDLDELFDKCNMGIGSLANHRKGLMKDSALKNREYCARGIPFVIASDDDGFNRDYKYILRINPDESPVDINKIIKFYDSIKNDKYIEEMRSYAEQNLTWDAVMKPVIDAINSRNIDK